MHSLQPGQHMVALDQKSVRTERDHASHEQRHSDVGEPQPLFSLKNAVVHSCQSPDDPLDDAGTDTFANYDGDDGCSVAARDLDLSESVTQRRRAADEHGLRDINAWVTGQCMTHFDEQLRRASPMPKPNMQPA